MASSLSYHHMQFWELFDSVTFRRPQRPSAETYWGQYWTFHKGQHLDTETDVKIIFRAWMEALAFERKWESSLFLCLFTFPFKLVGRMKGKNEFEQSKCSKSSLDGPNSEIGNIIDAKGNWSWGKKVPEVKKINKYKQTNKRNGSDHQEKWFCQTTKTLDFD